MKMRTPFLSPPPPLYNKMQPETLWIYRSFARARASLIANIWSTSGSSIFLTTTIDAPWKLPNSSRQIAPTAPKHPDHPTAASTLIFAWPTCGGIQPVGRGGAGPCTLGAGLARQWRSARNLSMNACVAKGVYRISSWMTFCCANQMAQRVVINMVNSCCDRESLMANSQPLTYWAKRASEPAYWTAAHIGSPRTLHLQSPL